MTSTSVQHYIPYLNAFTDLLTAQEMERRRGKGKVLAHVQTGRKYDRVLLQTSTKHGTTDEVKYFVEKSTGIIYGKKTNVAPNLRWYFGTIYTAHLWDWKGEYPVPINDPSVEAVGKYGDDIKHYRPKTTPTTNIPYPEPVGS